MRWPVWVFAGFFAACAGQGFASEVVGPRIDLKIEGPVYVGMPVWLDVDVHDSCLEARYPASHYPGWFGPLHEAEIEFGGRRAKWSGYHMGLIQFSGTVATGACPGERKIGPASQHRFPLHLIASFDQPGEYRVRWIVGRAGGGTPPMARSAWLSFNVLPSSASQRDAWLTGLLAHRPADPKALAGNYVPSLLAAWNDPRVTHELLTLVCSPDNRVAIPAADAVRVHIPRAEQLYIAGLVEHGCMTDGVPRMIISDAIGLMGERPPVLQQDISQIFWEVAAANVLHGPAATVAPALTVMQWTYPSQLSEAGRIKAYRAVLMAGHAILAGTDQAAKSAWGEYVDRSSTLPEMKRLLRPLALRQGNVAEEARSALCNDHDPEELSLFAEWLAEPARGDDDEDMPRALVACYGQSSLGVLRTALRSAPSWRTRDEAAIELAKLGDKAGIEAVMAALRGRDFNEVHYVRSDLSEFPIPAGRDPTAAAIAYFQGQLAKAN